MLTLIAVVLTQLPAAGHRDVASGYRSGGEYAGSTFITGFRGE